jgi:hypothetical protein
VVQSLFTIFKDHSWRESLSKGAFISLQVARALKRFCHANDTLNRLLTGECRRLHLMEFVPDKQYDQTVVKRRFDRAVRRGVAQGRFCLRHGSIQPCEPVQSPPNPPAP